MLRANRAANQWRTSLKAETKQIRKVGAVPEHQLKPSVGQIRDPRPFEIVLVEQGSRTPKTPNPAFSLQGQAGTLPSGNIHV